MIPKEQPVWIGDMAYIYRYSKFGTVAVDEDNNNAGLTLERRPLYIKEGQR